MAAAKDDQEIAQIAFYLAKPTITFNTVIDKDAELNKRFAYRQHDFKADGIDCRFIYFETKNSKTNPSWLDFVNAQLGSAGPITFQATSRNANGILLVKIDGHILVATFGRSANSGLVRSALEPDFGIKTAMNLCGNEEIRQTRTQSNSITPTHIDRQVSKPSEAFVFGLSEAEDLKYISAHMKGKATITLQGRDSLTIKVLGTERLNWDRLVTQCQAFVKAFKSKAYEKLFPNYRNFLPATDEEANALDAILIGKLQAKNLKEIQLCIPEFVPDDEFSYSYTDHDKKENRIYSHLDPKQLKVELDLAEVTVTKLQAKHVYAYSHVDDRVLSNRCWPLYDCILFEHKLKGKYFLLSDGRWLAVDGAFYKAITDFVQKRLTVEKCEQAFEGISIFDSTAKKNLEKLFNETACQKKKECILFDRAKLRIGVGPKNKEFCDILDFADDGVVRIINCKPFSGASAITYLFSQAKFYCEAFLTDETFLADIREHIQNSGSALTQQYLSYVQDDVRKLHAQNYRVCLWLLYDHNEQTPSASDIPLIAQYELKLMHDHLTRVCKFKDIILRFIPVQRVSFTRKVTPTAQAA